MNEHPRLTEIMQIIMDARADWESAPAEAEGWVRTAARRVIYALEDSDVRVNDLLGATATIVNQNSAYEEQNTALRKMLTELCDHVAQSPVEGQLPDLHGWDIVERIRREAHLS